MAEDFTPTFFLKRTCPFCLKMRIFLTEAGIADRYRYVVFDDGDDTQKGLRERMEAAGTKPGFPAAEFTAGKLDTGTDALISRLAAEHGTGEPDAMPLLRYYSAGVFARYSDMFKELQALKA